MVLGWACELHTGKIAKVDMQDGYCFKGLTGNRKFLPYGEENVRMSGLFRCLGGGLLPEGQTNPSQTSPWSQRAIVGLDRIGH